MGAQRTDVCTHCNIHFTQRDEVKAHEDSSEGDWAEVALGILHYIHTHNESHRLEDKRCLWLTGGLCTPKCKSLL